MPHLCFIPLVLNDRVRLRFDAAMPVFVCVCAHVWICKREEKKCRFSRPVPCSCHPRRHRADPCPRLSRAECRAHVWLSVLLPPGPCLEMPGNLCDENTSTKPVLRCNARYLAASSRTPVCPITRRRQIHSAKQSFILAEVISCC